MSKSKTKARYGIYYRSNGRWTGPYANLTFTKYTLNRQPVAGELKWLKNRALKSRIKLVAVER